MLGILLFLVFLFPPSVLAEPIVKITNFSSNSSPEWVEIYNQTGNIVDLSHWTIRDGNNILTDDLTLTGCLSPNSYQTFFHDDSWLNNTSDTINLYDSQGVLIDTLTYSSGKINLNYQSNNTCVSTPTPSSVPTDIPAPTSTTAPLPTITPTPSSPPTSTPTPTVRPTAKPTLKPSITPSPTLEPPLTPVNDPLPSLRDDPPSVTPDPEPASSPAVLSASTSSSTNYLPFIFIVLGGLLLIIPVIISKIKK